MLKHELKMKNTNVSYKPDSYLNVHIDIENGIEMKFLGYFFLSRFLTSRLRNQISNAI